MILKKYLYLAGAFIRNNSIDSNFKFLLQSQKWSIERLENYQYRKLNELLNYAYMNSEYYRDIFKKNNIHPKNIKSVKDLYMIPILNKKDLIENSSKIQTKKGKEKLFYSETSGSTGKPLVFYRNKDWDAWHRASVLRGMSWYGVKPWERNGYLWGYNLSLKRRIQTILLDYMVNRFRLFSYKDSEIECFIKKMPKAVFLSGYSSMIYEIAKKINNTRYDCEDKRIDLKLIKGTSEKIYDKYQEEAILAFGKKITSEYGAAEAGIIAFECPKGKMHINMETVVVEEKEKQIVVTNLVSSSFPIIRYKLGDYIEMEKEANCECGMKHPIIKEITGRVGKKIYGTKNTYPSLTLYYVFKNLARDHKMIVNYRAIQSTMGHLKLEIESKLKNDDRKLLVKEFKKYFSDDLSLSIIEEVKLKSKEHKRKDFISEIS